MSNRAYLIRTRFDGDDGVPGWGWRVGDDQFRSYADDHEEQEVPGEPLQLLAKACTEATEQERLFFEDVLAQEKGLLINGSWQEFEHIEPVLRRVLELEQ